MKRALALFLALAFVFALIPASALAAPGPDGDYITIVGNKADDYYLVGQRVTDATGKLAAHYFASAASAAQAVTPTWSYDGATVTSTTIFKASATTLTATYVSPLPGGASLTATVDLKIYEKALTGITVTKMPTQTTYDAGTPYVWAGMEVTATYSNGTTDIKTSFTAADGFTIAPTDAGSTNITITYAEAASGTTNPAVTKTTTIPVTSSGETANYIYVKQPNQFPYEHTTITASGIDDYFWVGQPISEAVSKLTLKYYKDNDSATTGVDVTANATWSVTGNNNGYFGSAGETIAITATCTSPNTNRTLTSAVYTVKVKAKELKELTLKTLPTTKEYYKGENVDLSGIVLIASYENSNYTQEIKDVNLLTLTDKAAPAAGTPIVVSYSETVYGSKITKSCDIPTTATAAADKILIKTAAVVKDIVAPSAISIGATTTVEVEIETAGQNADISLDGTWTSSNPEVATFTLTTATATKLTFTALGKSVGSATLTYSPYGGTAKTVSVSVTETKVYIDSIALSQTSMSLAVGGSFTLGATITPTTTTESKGVVWKAGYVKGTYDNTPITDGTITIDSTGKVTALKMTDAATPTIYIVAETLGSSDAAGTKLTSAPCALTVTHIPVVGLTLATYDMTMYKLATVKLGATVSPSNTSYPNVVMTSSNPAIVEPTNEGMLTAKALGEAVITVTAGPNAAGQKITRTCKVKVVDAVLITNLTLNKNETTLSIGNSETLTVTLAPANATTKTIAWTSGDESIATVTSSGMVTGIKAGTTYITATANDGSGWAAGCTVTVTNIISTAVTLNKAYLPLIEADKEKLVATIFPSNVSLAKVSWSSTNTSVAVVANDGTVTGVGKGTAVIKATAVDGSQEYASCFVSVTPRIAVNYLTQTYATLSLLLNDSTYQFVDIFPNDATNKAVTWTSSDKSVVVVTPDKDNAQKCLLAGVKEGTATVTATVDGKSISCNVYVGQKIYSNGVVVNCSRRVNTRAAASGSSGFVGFAYKGDVYKVLGKSTNWYKIQYNADTVAWIWSRYLQATEIGAGYTSAGRVTSTGAATTAPTTTTTTTTSNTVTIVNCENCVNVRSGAGTNFSKLGYAYLNSTFVYTKKTGDWYEINYADGVTGYVNASFCQAN